MYCSSGKEIMYKIVLILVCLPSIFTSDEEQSTKPAGKKTFDQLFSVGVRAYTDQTWYLCASSLEAAIKDYKFYRNTIIDCRLQCKKDTSIHEQDDPTSELLEVSVLEKLVHNSDCLRRCTSDKFEDRKYPDPRDRIYESFRKRKPYEFLQFCWFQLDRVNDAASAAYTVYLENPDNDDIVSNIRYYKDTVGVQENEFLDLELRPYKEAYIRGLLAYNNDDWEGVRQHMEEAITEFYREEERCRAECEDIYDYGVPQDFIRAVADHYISVLECQSGCELKLSRVFTEELENFVPEHYHYLQFAYFKLNNDEKAMEALESFLLFEPDDETMWKNKALYVNKGYRKKDFNPRKKAVEYLQRKQQRQRVLEFVRTKYRKDESRARKDEEEEEGEGDVKNGERNNPGPDEWMKPYERVGLKLVSHGDDMMGRNRFAIDGFLRSEQCTELTKLVKWKKANKHGARAVGIKEIQEMVLSKNMDLEVGLRFLLRISESSRHFLMKYYKLPRLFFERTSMVCWDSVKQREDEPVEDCQYYLEDGSCTDEMQLGIEDDEYMAILYLNDIPADEGSNIYFLAEDETIESKLGIKCGRLVGFEASDRHGVSIPYSQERCAVVVRFSTDPRKDEKDYVDTIKSLHTADEEYFQSMLKNKNTTLEDLQKAGIKIAKRGADLKGKERVVADGLADEHECQMMKNLVQEFGKGGSGYDGDVSPHTDQEQFMGFSMGDAGETGALVGDGYEHLPSKPSLISPHTEHEMFQGLTVYRAAKLVDSERVSHTTVEVFLDLSEKARLFVERYFNLTAPLFFDFTHLVCRTAMDDTNLDRPDLSHPVHADNCNLQADGSCPKEFPAFTQRDYSAILYLNSEFEGGEFFFANSDKTEQVTLHPKCGRIVGFSSGEFHGVKAVVKGTRCALALWFTTNPQYKELAHLQARKLLAKKRKEFNGKENTHSEL